MKNNTYKKPFRIVLLTASVLAITACQTTNTNYDSNMNKVDKVLERATYDAASSGQLNESLALLERLYKRNSGDIGVSLRYARALRYTKNYQKASLVLSPFIKGNQYNSDAVAEYAYLQAAMGNYVMAEDYARKAVLDNPEAGQNYHILGVALDAQGYHKQAETAFRRALDHWEGDPTPVLNNLGLNLAAQGFLDEALEILRRAHQTSPNRREIERNLRIVSALASHPYEGYVEDKHIPVPPTKPGATQESSSKKDAASAPTKAEPKQPVKDVKSEPLDDQTEKSTSEDDGAADDGAADKPAPVFRSLNN